MYDMHSKDALSSFLFPQVSEATASYIGHVNYIRAFASIAGFTSSTVGPTTVLSKVRESCTASSTLATQLSTNAIRDQARRSLTSAWGTELILCLSGEFIEEDELMRLANNWAVVQAYYTLYHSTQALAAAKGYRRSESHSATQKLYADFWLKPKPIGLNPWTLGYSSTGPINAPTSQHIDVSLNAWSQCTTATRYSLACQALRTTRRDDGLKKAVSAKREELRRKNRKAWSDEEQSRISTGKRPRKEPTFGLPRLSPADRTAVDGRLRPYGLIDYLYRLRIKTNYLDSAMFTDGPQDEESARSIHADLRNLVSATMLVHELHICSLLGSSVVKRWVEAWLKANSVPGHNLGLSQRSSLISL